MSKRKFFLRKVFNGKHRVTITDADLAKFYQISEEEARSYIEHDIKAGFCIANRTYSTYYLTFFGLQALYHEIDY